VVDIVDKQKLKFSLMETKELGFTRLVLLTKEHRSILKSLDNILIDFYS
jgi:hypothetical protein